MADCKDTERLIEKLREENEWLKAENFKFCARACSAENELSDKNKLIKDLRNVIAKHLEWIQFIVNRQAEDEGLWFVAETAPEAYLQQELRALHSVIEVIYRAALEKDDE